MYCKLKQCCCGCSLRTGTAVISVFSLIVSAGLIIQNAFNISLLGSSSANDAEMFYYLCVGQLVGAVVSVLITVLVLFAVWKNRMPRLLLPWLVMQIVSLIVTCSFLIFWAVAVITAGGTGMTYVLGVCVGGALGFYSWLVVLSYYHELNAKVMMEEQLPGEKVTVQFHHC